MVTAKPWYINDGELVANPPPNRGRGRGNGGGNGGNGGRGRGGGWTGRGRGGGWGPGGSGGGGDPGVGTGTETFFNADLATRPWLGAQGWPTEVYLPGADKTFYAWNADTPPQTAKVAGFDHATGDRIKPVTVDTYELQNDDHGGAVLCPLSDGRLLCFYGSHNSDQEWSISDASGGEPDITNWTRQSALSGAYTYPHPVNIPDGSGGGTVYLFLRVTALPNLPLILKTATYTSGGAVSFGADTTIVDLDGGFGARVYTSEIRATDATSSANIEFFATRADADDDDRQHVYYFRYIPSTGAVENIDASTSTASGSLPIDLTNANSNYREVDSGATNNTGLISCCRDANGDLHIIYGDDANGADPFDVKHNVYDESGGTWGTAVVAFTVKDHLGAEGVVEIWSILSLGSGDQVEAWYPSGQTGAWATRGGDSMARRTYASGSWGSEEIIVTGDSLALSQPTSVLNGSADLRVGFSEVTQTNNDADAEFIKRYAWGDSGVVRWDDPVDPYLYQVCLLLGFNGSDAAAAAEDESHWQHLHPVAFNGNAQLDTAQKKFGTASLSLDGTGDYLVVPPSRTAITQGAEWKPTGDTVECFIRLAATGKKQTILATRDVSNDGFQFQVESTNLLKLLVWDGSGVIINIDGTTALSQDTWYYVAFQRNNNDWEIFLDGSSEGTDTSVNGPAEGGDLNIGRGELSGNYFEGWIDEIRWTKRVLRDVSSVPTAAFPRGT